jgi:uncharacterized tellurite resistance protein B-like protein
MYENFKKFFHLVENDKKIFNDIENEDEFKLASANIICNVVNVNSEDREKYCKLFQEKFDLPKEELQDIKGNVNDSVSLDEHIKVIKEELKYNRYEMMEFLDILNKFIIIDNCAKEDYEIFEEIKNKFLNNEEI